jgi:hypothetical protein
MSSPENPKTSEKGNLSANCTGIGEENDSQLNSGDLHSEISSNLESSWSSLEERNEKDPGQDLKSESHLSLKDDILDEFDLEVGDNGNGMGGTLGFRVYHCLN